MSVSKSDEKLLILASLMAPTEIILLEKYYIKHSTPCFITRWNMHLEVRQKQKLRAQPLLFFLFLLSFSFVSMILELLGLKKHTFWRFSTQMTATFVRLVFKKSAGYISKVWVVLNVSALDSSYAIWHSGKLLKIYFSF